MVSFPANRIAAVSESILSLRPAHAFYRVVAIDEKGRKSGSSDALPARRPVIFSEPVKEARVGNAYRYETKTLASLGDLRCRTIGSECYNAAFWDAEKPRFTLAEGPGWLKMDAATGVLVGTPQAADAGDREIRITAEIAGIGTDAQKFTLRCRAP